MTTENKTDSEEHIRAPEIMNGIWLIHQESGELIILPREGSPTFDTIGSNEEKIEALHIAIREGELSDDMLEDDETLSKLGYDYCYDWQRRFSGNMGYYYA